MRLTSLLVWVAVVVSPIAATENESEPTDMERMLAEFAIQQLNTTINNGPIRLDRIVSVEKPKVNGFLFAMELQIRDAADAALMCNATVHYEADVVGLELISANCKPVVALSVPETLSSSTTTPPTPTMTTTAMTERLTTTEPESSLTRPMQLHTVPPVVAVKTVPPQAQRCKYFKNINDVASGQVFPILWWADDAVAASGHCRDCDGELINPKDFNPNGQGYFHCAKRLQSAPQTQQ